MGAKTGIAWTDATWNPIRGCSRVSLGCKNCYAEVVAARFSKPGLPYEGLATHKNGEARWTGDVRFVHEALHLPTKWRKPRRIFVNSMSDLFHEKVEDRWIDSIFSVMQDAQRHTYQILTKRPMRMMDFCKVQQKRGWPVLPNVWLGVSVEDQITADERIPLLLKTPAHVRWVSYEPALGPVDFSRWMDWSQGPALDWIVVGGESGPRARPFNPGWARQTIAQCQASLVPVFVKQLGSRVATDFVNGEAVVYGIKDRKGADPAEWPADLRVMEYPRP